MGLWRRKPRAMLIAAALLTVGCAPTEGADYFESEPEILAEGFGWSEGPVWIADGDYLLFSDVSGNAVYKWSEQDGLETFLDPSGYDGPETDIFREPGINGIIPGRPGYVLAASHGDRAIVEIDLETREKRVIVDNYDGARFSSPNDLVQASDGSLYFTDPPYGLAGLNESPAKELDFNGVYLLAPDGSLSVVDDSLTFPNGVVLSPDERTLYVAVSDPQAAIWYAYDRAADGTVSNRRVLYDATPRIAAGQRGLPDGMAVAATGEIVATGPGGLYVFAAEGAEPVVLDVGSATANCAFGEDGKTLFVAAHNRLLRIRTGLTGLGY